MTADQEHRCHPVLAIVLTAVLLAPPAFGLLDDLGAEGAGEIAWELAHGLPSWRKNFRSGWHQGRKEHQAKWRGET